MSFSENLRELLDFKDIEIKELAAGTGISKHTLDNYLSGQKSLPNVENGVKIARFLGTSVEFLVEGQEMGKETEFPSGALLKDLKHLNRLDYYSIAHIVSSLAKRQEG